MRRRPPTTAGSVTGVAFLLQDILFVFSVCFSGNRQVVRPRIAWFFLTFSLRELMVYAWTAGAVLISGWLICYITLQYLQHDQCLVILRMNRSQELRDI